MHPAASLESGIRCLPFGTADGARNMALDQAMMDMARSGRTLLRFYGWEPWCLSLGRNQPLPRGWLQRHPDVRIGYEAVRRPTGGRSVLHGPELTYALACPDRAWGGPRALYLRIHRALSEGLRAIGAVLDESPAPGSSGPELAPSAQSCFDDPAPGELTARGRKLVGSAQWRHRGTILQHGSLLIENRQASSDLARQRPEVEGEEAATGAIGLNELLEALPHTESLLDDLLSAFGFEFGGIRPADAELDDALSHRASGLEPVYRSEDWFRRRTA